MPRPQRCRTSWLRRLSRHPIIGHYAFRSAALAPLHNTNYRNAAHSLPRDLASPARSAGRSPLRDGRKFQSQNRNDLSRCRGRRFLRSRPLLRAFGTPLARSRCLSLRGSLVAAAAPTPLVVWPCQRRRNQAHPSGVLQLRVTLSDPFLRERETRNFSCIFSA